MVRFVLVRPRIPENVGAAARVLRNFGHADWVLVDPERLDLAAARRMAVGAEDLLDGVRVAPTLDLAVSDCAWVVGTESRRGLLFLLSRGLSVGVTLYAPSLVLSVVLGWSERDTILLMGLSTIAYVLYGGNRSVIWTDVVQMAIIWFGIFVCLGVAIVQLPEHFGLHDGLALAQAAGRLNSTDLSLDTTRPYTLWTGLIGGTFLALAYFGTDQSQVQRYLAGASLTQSRLALLFNAFLKVPMQFLILLTGVLVFVFYHFHPAPLLWNSAELKRLEQRADPQRLAAILDRYDGAQASREAAARLFALQRREGRAPEVEPLRRAQATLEGARAQAVCPCPFHYYTEFC